MKTIEIKSKTGEILLDQEISDEDSNQNFLDVVSDDYMVAIEKDGLIFKATDAVDGYGNNCRELFKDSTIDIY